jgi:TRAP transporter TAXI family solute receptor
MSARFWSVLLFGASIAMLASETARAAENTFISIGTAGVTGVYFPAGGAICRLVNRSQAKHGIRCSVEQTGGSVVNINRLRSSTLDFALVQSDWQYYAFHGASSMRDAGPFKNLRSIFSLHVEPFTVVVRSDSGIHKFEDLKGKRVNIGNPGSGQRGTMDIAMQALGWTTGDFASVFELSTDEQSPALCEDRIDAMVVVAGYPSGSVKEATTLCNAVLVQVGNNLTEKLVQDNVFYSKAVIPAGVYSGNNATIRTFGTLATFVTTNRMSADTVYQVVKSVFDDLARFKKQHPAFRSLEPSRMLKDGISAPFHLGAVRYYKERGWQ